jgi:glycogen debranching enzyme
MGRHRQNFEWQYHNGGVWPMVGGFWIAALAACGEKKKAQAELTKLARVCELGNWRFTEWLQGKTLASRGMAGQSWNAAGYLLAEAAVSGQLPRNRAATHSAPTRRTTSASAPCGRIARMP